MTSPVKGRTPEARLENLLHEYGFDTDLEGMERHWGMTFDLDQRYVLVEENLKNAPSHWFSSHDTPDDASDYHHNQEYAEDYAIVELVDLGTGQRLEPAETRTAFTRTPLGGRHQRPIGEASHGTRKRDDRRPPVMPNRPIVKSFTSTVRSSAGEI